MSNDPSSFSWDAGETIGPARPRQPAQPPRPTPPPQRPAPRRRQNEDDEERDRPKKRIPTAVKVVLGVLAGVVLLIVVVCAGIINFFNSVGASPQAREPFPVASVPVPPLPERGQPMQFEPGIDFYEISLGPQGGIYGTPGHGGLLWLYLPGGQHPPRSLPCVLITTAGTNMLFGNCLGEGAEAEHLPYVHAGCAVIAYEMDGYLDTVEEFFGPQGLPAYEAFRKAGAGTVNARNALEFALARVPEVDPARIFVAGHSSAASAALLAAAHDPRIAGVMAYAPCYDVVEFLGPPAVRLMGGQYPGLADFAVQSSPKTHESRIQCPIFLFNAEDDSIVSVADSRAACDRLRGMGKDVTLEIVPTGDHYDSMINEGIPRAIQWLRTRGAIR